MTLNEWGSSIRRNNDKNPIVANKVYIVVVGLESNDIDSGHATIKSANKAVIDIAKGFGVDIFYDNRGCAYSADGECWICEVEIENNI